MPLVRSQAIVLRSYPLSESDLIVVLYSLEHGKIRLVAKRGRRLRDQFVGCLCSLSHLRVGYYERENRDLSYLSTSDLIESFFELQSDFEFQAASAYLVEVVDSLCPDREPNAKVFRLLLAMCRARKSGVPSPEILVYFNLWILRLSGIWPGIERCVLCASPLSNAGGRFFPEEQKAYCSKCRPHSGQFISPEAARLAESCFTIPLEKVGDCGYPARTFVALNSLLEPMIVKAVDKPMKSLGILHSIATGL